MNTEERIVAVIPAYNEEKTIGKTLDALCDQSVLPYAVVVVNNNSTDGTVRVIEEYRSRYKDRLPIYPVEEPRKGTGIACNTGFRYAIDVLGATIISRTDADTLPAPQWNEAIQRYFALHPHKKLLAGPHLPYHGDEFYRYYDRIVWPLFWNLIRIGGVPVKRSLHTLRFGFGCNVALRRGAYEAVGGFSHTSIEESDEDLALSKAVHDMFGFRALGYARKMIVYTSMRRVRKVGYSGFIEYYVIRPNKEHRMKKTEGVVDIR